MNSILKSFEYKEMSGIAPLAWLADIKKAKHTISVTHGCSVETWPDFFAEGAWAGPLCKGDILSNDSFASGAILRENELVFCPPDHTLMPLYIRKDEYSLKVSNSLGLMLAENDENIILDFENYTSITNEIADGVSDEPIILPIEGRVYEMRYWTPFSVDLELNIRLVEKKRSVILRDFSDYKSHIINTLKKILDNAADPLRKKQYTAITPLSSGYDSTAIAVLATELGHLDAVSIMTSRPDHKGDKPDDGIIAANVLRMNLSEVGRFDYMSTSGATDLSMPEIETMGAGSEFSSMRSIIKGRVVLTGFIGDVVWDRASNHPISNFDLRKAGGSYGGHNFAEMRLWADSILLPVPFIGAEQHADIQRISNLPEMANWTLNTSYDRPICRRIGEEAGIPRDAFGQEKKAAGVFYRIEGLKNTMTPASYDDYMEFFKRHGRRINWARISSNKIKYFFWRANLSIRKRFHFKTKQIFGKGIYIPLIVRYPPPVTKGALLFSWATDHIRQRYMEGLNRADVNPPKLLQK